MQSYQIIARGKVQGVGYRAFVREQALELKLTGFVKNQWDGSVYIEASGNKEALDALVGYCKKGSVRALVGSVEVSQIPDQKYKHFSIQY